MITFGIALLRVEDIIRVYLKAYRTLKCIYLLGIYLCGEKLPLRKFLYKTFSITCYNRIISNILSFNAMSIEALETTPEPFGSAYVLLAITVFVSDIMR